MTKKDYIAIAKVISDERNHPSGGKSVQITCDRLANRFADVLQSDNPRFDRARFLHACGVSD